MVNASSPHLFFSQPESPRRAVRIIPVFIPFAGCRERCIFCAQEKQTGVMLRSVQSCIDELAQKITTFSAQLPHVCMSDNVMCTAKEKKNEKSYQLTEEISTVAQNNQAMQCLQNVTQVSDCCSENAFEVAFFGGTFTSMKDKDQFSLLELANNAKQQGAVFRIRCSTRPDAITPRHLHRLKQSGLDMVELGIQSFSNAALVASRRGYVSDVALDACHMVQDAGLQLGIQLMPGLPGHTTRAALEDCRIAANLQPDNVRLYPCLVFDDTPLAELWRKGEFSPWSLDETVCFLAEVVPRFWQEGIAVIRMGIAPEPAAIEHILAGPYHPALGSMVRGQAVFALVSRQVEAFRRLHPCSTRPDAPLQLQVPRRHQGEFWGHRANLVPAYASLGISREQVLWTDDRQFCLSRASDLTP